MNNPSLPCQRNLQVLTLFWNLAHSNDVSLDIMDQALSAHVKILDYSCTQYREAQKMKWLDRCIEELKNSPAWVLPALKQIREICCLYQVCVLYFKVP
jgi:ubiquitin carboxyl-terminal hydrolase 9/24